MVAHGYGNLCFKYAGRIRAKFQKPALHLKTFVAAAFPPSSFSIPCVGTEISAGGLRQELSGKLSLAKINSLLAALNKSSYIDMFM